MSAAHFNKRKVKPKEKQEINGANVDQLADQLASTLKVTSRSSKIQTESTKKNIKLKASETKKNDVEVHMRNVNFSLQSLESVVQSGWRANSSRKGGEYTLASVSAMASTARTSLCNIRKAGSSLMDIERAASSIVSKLIVIEMFDQALHQLYESHKNLSMLCIHDQSEKSFTAPPKSMSTADPSMHIFLLSINIPSDCTTLDPKLQSLMVSYFTHAHTVVIHYVIPRASAHKSLLQSISSPGSLLFWIDRFTDVLPLTIDKTYKRIYVTLATSFTSPPASSHTKYQCRLYGLKHLLLTSDLDADKFWNQATQFTLSYLEKSSGSVEDENAATREALQGFQMLQEYTANNRKGIESGANWMTFCEYWLALARRVRDMETVLKVSSYIRSTSSTSTEKHQKNENAILDITSQELESSKENDLNFRPLNLYASLTETVAIFESLLSKDLSENDGALSKLRLNDPYLRDHLSQTRDANISPSTKRRLLYVVEKLRRVTVKALCTKALSTDTLLLARSILETITLDVQHALENQYISAENEVSSAKASALESLLTLATSVLSSSTFQTHDQAYSYLVSACHIAEMMTENSQEKTKSTDYANFIRCISSAAFNIAGVLYKANQYSSAIRFLTDATSLGCTALHLSPDNCKNKPDTSILDAHNEKETNSWEQLKAQIYKRWELLGICYLKIGDRRRALDCFIESIKAYYFDDNFCRLVSDNISMDVVSLPEYKSLAAMIDRLTYISAAELFLGQQTSLLIPMQESNHSNLIIGAVLAQQIQGLERSRWKPEIQNATEGILRDLYSVYSEDLPLLRTRAIILRLEHAYFTESESIDVQLMAQEVQSLLSNKKSKSTNNKRERYLASVYLWLGLHIQKRGELGGAALVRDYASEACQILNSCSTQRKTKKPYRPSIGHDGNSKTVKGNKENIILSPDIRAGKLLPTTPKPKKSNATMSSPKMKDRSEVINNLMHPEDRAFFNLLCMMASLLGLLNFGFTKIELLTIIARLSEGEPGAEDLFVRMISELAYELAKLGKIEQAGRIHQFLWTQTRSAGCKISKETIAVYTLQFAEYSLLLGDISHSAAMYQESSTMTDELLSFESKDSSTFGRIQERASALERAAVAARIFANIQSLKGQSFASIDNLLRSLRLYNRAADTISRMKPAPKISTLESSSSNPFEITHAKGNEDKINGSAGHAEKVARQKDLSIDRSFLFGLEWRIANGLLHTLFALAQAYYYRGSAREAEYFAQEAETIAESMLLYPTVVQILVLKCEILLGMGKSEEAHQTLEKAGSFISEQNNLETADLKRLQGDCSLKTRHDTEAEKLYLEAATLLNNLDAKFTKLEVYLPQPQTRKPNHDSPKNNKVVVVKNPIAPFILASILRQYIWILRQNNAPNLNAHLERILDLPSLVIIKTETNALLGQLAFHDVNDRLRSDMSLNSLAESTIAMPMPMSCDNIFSQGSKTQGIVELLNRVGELLISGLESSKRGSKFAYVRDTMMSLIRVRTFQTSLGRVCNDDPSFACKLLDIAASITLRHEMIEALRNKLQRFVNMRHLDDLVWQNISVDGSPIRSRRSPKRILLIEDSPIRSRRPPKHSSSDDPFETEDLSPFTDSSSETYLQYLLDKYESPPFETSDLCKSEVDILPENWVVVNISVTEDKSTLIISRQRASTEPVLFCIPLKHRRDNAGIEEAHLTLESALAEFSDIITRSDTGTKNAVNVAADDQEAKAAWWAQRKQLDQRLKVLLDNIEFCWLGAFKTILSQPMKHTPEALSALRTRLDKVFKNIIHPREKKAKIKVKYNDNILECISSLPTTCRNEELEDLVYFVLDLYHIHGIPIALAEVDIDQVVVDLRTQLEDYNSKMKANKSVIADSHMFLVLDRNVQGVPWESIPILRGKSVSRIPSITFLFDRLQLARHRLGLPFWTPDSDQTQQKIDRINVNPSSAFFVLNPSGDLSKTEDRFLKRVSDMRDVGWEGLVREQPSEQQLLYALEKKDLVVYFGHGGAEQYIRSHKIRHLSQCAATMLWGCSSGALRDMGDFDRIGTPINYMLGGCPTLVANLWDVTDRDIDKFTLSVFDKLHLEASMVKKWHNRQNHDQAEAISIVTAVAQSRDVCKLKYLTGAAPIVYGIPFYL